MRLKVRSRYDFTVFAGGKMIFSHTWERLIHAEHPRSLAHTVTAAALALERRVSHTRIYVRSSARSSRDIFSFNCAARARIYSRNILSRQARANDAHREASKDRWDSLVSRSIRGERSRSRARDHARISRLEQLQFRVSLAGGVWQNCSPSRKKPSIRRLPFSFPYTSRGEAR